MKGKNGIEVVDNGNTWRLLGSRSVTSFQTYNFMNRDETPTGVTYGIGYDKTVNGTRISHIDYPKSRYSMQELMDDPQYVKILGRCNICHAFDQAAAQNGHRPYESVPSVPSVSPSVPERLSIGPVVAATLPRWLPVALNAAKQFAFRPVGELGFSLGVSIVADMLSGVTSDPNYQKALRALSDESADSIDPALMERVKRDALAITEAAYKDGEDFVSKKRIMSSIFKTKEQLKNEVEATLASERNNINQHQPTYSPSSMDFQPRNINGPPRLFEL